MSNESERAAGRRWAAARHALCNGVVGGGGGTTAFADLAAASAAFLATLPEPSAFGGIAALASRLQE